MMILTESQALPVLPLPVLPLPVLPLPALRLAGVAKPSAPARRRKAERLGRGAEEEVARRLEAQGFAVLARRLRTKAGEIDLVVADAQLLVFVEVKARGCLADAAYAVSARQQARLLEAASLALAAHEDWARPDIRFDVALVAGAAVAIVADAIRYS